MQGIRLRVPLERWATRLLVMELILGLTLLQVAKPLATARWVANRVVLSLAVAMVAELLMRAGLMTGDQVLVTWALVILLLVAALVLWPSLKS
ncbi:MULTISPECIES: hypothetical protein [Pseudomonas]|uniref:hypothetical protein n=1 Tax=Pseudomonas TaxID=286 RepID=UPI000760D1E9|nr:MULTISPECIES: hypothetical protein [Pseudomonas]MDG9809417.1 hypothetical protein [Pseudomonas juntendi]MDG9815774.1 hypothetical protein [Pseudomonas putida]